LASASALTLVTEESAIGEGLLATREDVDVFTFATGTGEIVIDAVPFNYPTKGYANLDLELKLYDSSGTLVTSNNGSTVLNATLSATVAAGTYYVQVSGVGKGDPSTGYSDYG